MPKKNVGVIEQTFSNEDVAQFNDHKKAIHDLQTQAEGVAEAIAYHLWDINRKKLYLIEAKPDGGEYKGIGEYAEINFDISRGTCSDSIATFERFGNPETHLIDAKYKDYKFSNLIALKKLSDAEIELGAITSKSTKVQIKAALPVIEKKKAQIALLPAKHDKALQDWNTLLSHPDFYNYSSRMQEELAEHSDKFKQDFKIADLDYNDTEYISNVTQRYTEELLNYRKPTEDKYKEVIDAIPIDDPRWEECNNAMKSQHPDTDPELDIEKTPIAVLADELLIIKDFYPEYFKEEEEHNSTIELESDADASSEVEQEGDNSLNSTIELPEGTQTITVTLKEYEEIKKYIGKKLNKTMHGNQLFICVEGE